eukprot:scaffold723_cov363-Prasinococcus_capsulatus_cf.AAC.7
MRHNCVADCAPCGERAAMDVPSLAGPPLVPEAAALVLAGVEVSCAGYSVAYGRGRSLWTPLREVVPTGLNVTSTVHQANQSPVAKARPRLIAAPT